MAFLGRRTPFKPFVSKPPIPAAPGGGGVFHTEYFRRLLATGIGMRRNTASQKLTVFAFTPSDGLPKTGDAANLTAYVSIDNGALGALTDTSGSEIDSTNAKGYYRFDLTQAETNGDKLEFTCKSATAGVVVIAAPAVVQTVPEFFSNQSTVLVSTTIATLASQQSFTLTAGSADDTAYEGCIATIQDQTTSAQKAVIVISAYTGGTKTVSVNGATPAFNAAAGDYITILASPVKADLAQDFFDQTGTGILDYDLTGTLSMVTAISAAGATAIRSLASGTSDSGTTTTMVDAARTEADTDYWKGNLIVFTSGNISGQKGVITGFTPGTDTITFSPATTQAVGTHTYEIWPAGDFLRPTTTGRTLDVSSGGEAGVDWANIGSPTSTNSLSNTTISTTQVVASIGSGGITSSSFASGAITAGSIASDAITSSELAASAVDEIVDAVWDEARSGHVTAGTFGEGAASVQGNVTGSVGSIASGGITAASIAADAIGASELAADAVAEIADAVWDEARSGHVSAGSFGEYTLADVTRISGDATAADNAESFFDGTGYAGTNNVIPTVTLVNTLTTYTGNTPQTGDSFARIGAGGASLTAVPWNASWDTEVQSEVQDAIEVNHLDHLLAAAYDSTSEPGHASALLNVLVQNDGGVPQFTTNALELAPAGGGGGGGSLTDADKRTLLTQTPDSD